MRHRNYAFSSSGLIVGGMTEDDRLQSIVAIDNGESHFISLMAEYEELLDQVLSCRDANE